MSTRRKKYVCKGVDAKAGKSEDHKIKESGVKVEVQTLRSNSWPSLLFVRFVSSRFTIGLPTHSTRHKDTIKRSS